MQVTCKVSRQTPIITPESDFVTKEELSFIQKEIDSLKAKFSDNQGEGCPMQARDMVVQKIEKM